MKVPRCFTENAYLHYVPGMYFGVRDVRGDNGSASRFLPFPACGTQVVEQVVGDGLREEHRTRGFSRCRQVAGGAT